MCLGSPSVLCSVNAKLPSAVLGCGSLRRASSSIHVPVRVEGLADVRTLEPMRSSRPCVIVGGPAPMAGPRRRPRLVAVVPGGVVVAHGTLDPMTQVRILAGQRSRIRWDSAQPRPRSGKPPKNT